MPTRASELPDEPDFIRSEGLFFFAHLLRRLSDELVKGCEDWYPSVGLCVSPRTASTLHLLYRRGPQSVMQIAAAIRQSHPLVIGWIRQLKQHGMVETLDDPSDRRRTIIALTETGRAEVRHMLEAHSLIEDAYRQLMQEADADVFDGLWRIEEILRKKGLADRLLRIAKDRVDKGASPVNMTKSS